MLKYISVLYVWHILKPAFQLQVTPYLQVTDLQLYQFYIVTGFRIIHWN